MTNELKPCPFCGGEAAFGYIRFTAEIYRPDGTQREDGHFVSCVRCGSSNQGVCCGYDTQDKALELWNRRAEQASQSQTDKYRKALEFIADNADMRGEALASIAGEALNAI